MCVACVLIAAILSLSPLSEKNSNTVVTMLEGQVVALTTVSLFRSHAQSLYTESCTISFISHQPLLLSLTLQTEN